jgi:hypothetical protein
MILENLSDGPFDHPAVYDELDLLPYARGASSLVRRHVVMACLLGTPQHYLVDRIHDFV